MLGAVAGVLVIACLLLGVRVIGSVTRPLRRVAVAANTIADLAASEMARISRDDEADTESAPRLAALTHRSSDEIGELASAFNRVQATAALLVEQQVVTRRNVTRMFGNIAVGPPDPSPGGLRRRQPGTKAPTPGPAGPPAMRSAPTADPEAERTALNAFVDGTHRAYEQTAASPPADLRRREPGAIRSSGPSAGRLPPPAGIPVPNDRPRSRTRAAHQLPRRTGPHGRTVPTAVPTMERLMTLPARISAEAQLFNGLLGRFATETAGVKEAITVSSDGLLIAKSATVDRADADRLAAITSAISALANGAARLYDLGETLKVIIDLDRGYLVVRAIGTGSTMGVLAAKAADLGNLAYDIAMFANRAGSVLTPTVIDELKNAAQP